MMNPATTIRNTAKAVIRNERGDILLLKKRYEDNSEVFTLPGGSQQPMESILSALLRECQEEIGCIVEAGELLYIAEFEKISKTPGKPPKHKVEFAFACEVPDTYTPKMGTKPDSHQVEVVWVADHQLQKVKLVPPKLSEYLKCKRLTLHRGATII